MTDLLTHDHEVQAPQGHGGHGEHTEMFRRRFWWRLLLTVPVVADQPHGHGLVRLRDRLCPGSAWVGPVLGSVIFFWGGWPFLDGWAVGDPRPASRG